MTATIAPSPIARPGQNAPGRIWIDLVAAATFAVIAAVATALPGGAGRALLTLPMILFIPGYLLVQAIAARGGGPSLFHVLVAFGLSPAIVGSLALMTAAVPGGFTASPIITIMTAACIVLAAVAFVRRTPAPDPEPQAATV